MSQALFSLFLLVVGCSIDSALSSCNASVSGLSETTVTLSWHRNCSVSPNVSYSVTYNGTAHCGEIIPPNSTEDLSGSYTVMGLEEFTGYTFILNSSNGDIATAQAYTEPAAPTGKPQELRAKRVTDDTVELTWKREECLGRNGQITGYVVQYSQCRGDETNDTVNITMGATQSCTVSSLAPNTTYRFQVAVFNSNGTGPFSDPISNTTLVEGTSSLSVGLAAGAAIAGVAVLIILTVVVVVLVVCLRRRRQQTAVSLRPNGAKYDETVEGSTRPGVTTVDNSNYVRVPAVHMRGYRAEATRDDLSQDTQSAIIENQHSAAYQKGQLTAPTIEPYQEELQVSEGERVTLMAGASGSPQPTITWVYKGREVEADCATELGEDGSLTLVCAEPKHAGTYHFTASNEAGSVKGSVTLIVCTDDEQGEGGTGLATVESSPLEVEWFGEGVSHLHACNNAGFILQYQSLPCGEVENSINVGTLPVNQLRNRFRNIVAYDRHPIILKPVPNFEHDYINASYIDGHSKPKKYIATQGPLPNTVTDFWRLVWQENVQAIAMLTNVTEGYQKKCEQYWPESKQNEEYGPFEVTVVDQKVFADYTVRIMQLEQSGMVGVRKKVVQFHFTSWPDHGAPEYAGTLLVYLRRIKSKYKPSKGPLLVHCSAGVGRTGTLIAIDTALEQAAEEGMVDIAGIVCRMRSQRMKMVQTVEQYVFIHDAVLESLVCGDTLIPSSELRKTTERLCVKDEQTGQTGFEMQLQVLDEVTPNPNEVVRSAALNNREKNRSMKFLPPDNWRVVLKAVTENYIHASYANGYMQNKGFIITQPPMRSTISDFWKMVYERECGVIVMLSNIIEDRKEVCFPYWPKVDKKSSRQYGEYAVSTSEFVVQYGYTQRIFTITGPQSDEVHKVTQFQMTGWSSEGLCTNHKALIGLVGEVTTEQMRTGNKSIVVHGSDTVSRSGIFCAFMNAMECCKAEGTVDVFQVVRALRIQKPGAVPTVEQYCSIFELMFLFLTSTPILNNCTHYIPSAMSLESSHIS